MAVGVEFFIALVVVAFARLSVASKVIILTDSNFDEKVKHGTWLVEAFHPWCQHCRDLEPTWEKVAEELDGEVFVAKIDVTQQPILLQRFKLRGYPSIFHLKDGQTREYKGKPTFTKLIQFAREGWREASPVHFFHAPNSAFGTMYGTALAVPSQAGQWYNYLSKDMGYSDLTVLGIVLAVPLSIGLLFICALDAYYVRRPLSPHFPGEHLHHE